jgi:salicylate hydroxylase
MDRSVRINIVGTGIAGLTAALALKSKGFQPVLYEQAPELGEVGAGLTIGPNAARVLIHLGLEERLKEYCWIPRHTGVLHYKTGERITYNLRGEKYIEDFGAPFWHIHRADLLNCLAEALDLGGSTQVHFDHHLMDVSQDEAQVTCRFENGQTAQSDVLIACDGLKSQARDLLFQTGPPEFTGFVAWRGLIDRKTLPGLKIDPDFALYLGQNRMIGRYALRNRSLINVVAITQQPDWSEEGWSIPADVEELYSEFAGWHESVTGLLKAIPPETCLKWALHVRKPMTTWVNGRVALLGDAAHPMTPFFGLGAAMGIEDALVLARVFEDSDNLEEAFTRYQAARVPRGTHIQAESSRQGLYLLNINPGDPQDKSLQGEDAIGMFGYDAVNVSV